MITLESQFKITINGKTTTSDNPKQALWTEIFNTTGAKYDPEFIDAFLAEVLALIKGATDGVDIQSLSDKMSWVLMVNCGLATKKDDKLVLTENGSDMIGVLEQLGVELPQEEEEEKDTGKGDDSGSIPELKEEEQKPDFEF